MTPSVREKRRETRRPAAGTVRVSYFNPQRLEIQGRLIDLSASGFRMAHGCTSLAAGQVVEFIHIEAAGKAQAIWTRIVEDRVETGFLVVES